jgi:hypothetical protein
VAAQVGREGEVGRELGMLGLSGRLARWAGMAVSVGSIFAKGKQFSLERDNGSWAG